MRWWKKLAIRFLLAALTVAVGDFLSATLARYAPGFGSDERQLDARLSEESLAALRQESAGERHVAVYYATAMGRMLRGDLGQSRVLRRPVRELLAERGIVTLRLVAAGLVVAWAATISLTLLVWLSGSGAMDVALSVSSGLLLCLPAGAVALLLVVFDGPAFVALALVVFPRTYQYFSNLLRATAQMPHIILARAEGSSRFRVFLLHVVPVVWREVLALAGVTVGMAVGAAIPVESLCGTPGLGQLAWQSAMARDVPVLTNLSMLVVACTVLANTGADMLSNQRRDEM